MKIASDNIWANVRKGAGHIVLACSFFYLLQPSYLTLKNVAFFGIGQQSTPSSGVEYHWIYVIIYASMALILFIISKLMLKRISSALLTVWLCAIAIMFMQSFYYQAMVRHLVSEGGWCRPSGPKSIKAITAPPTPIKAPQKTVPPNHNTHLTSKLRRGTYFFGGTGMQGAYINGFVSALRQAGIKHTYAVDAKRWSQGSIVRDAVSVILRRGRDTKQTDLSQFGTLGTQFNLIGYSFGGIQASQAALDYADTGGKVNHLILIGAPISIDLLIQLNNHPSIESIHLISLKDYGDPIYSGMSTLELLAAVPMVAGQFLMAESAGTRTGHYYYLGHSLLSQQRRSTFATQAWQRGLR
ncbi:hypothetical protein [Magnetococcus sp. PR-3]|uniref:hypothetical protein n=1 Tax=Magnetococcus sp. PR-3 TaxID=3120355 RepID=UPI002FCDEF12